MDRDQLKPNIIIRGPIFPEPVQVIVIIPMGTSVKLVGKGLKTGKVHEPILDTAQLATLEATPEKEPFDGDAGRFRLGSSIIHSIDHRFCSIAATIESPIEKNII